MHPIEGDLVSCPIVGVAACICMQTKVDDRNLHLIAASKTPDSQPSPGSYIVCSLSCSNTLVVAEASGPLNIKASGWVALIDIFPILWISFFRITISWQLLYSLPKSPRHNGGAISLQLNIRTF